MIDPNSIWRKQVVADVNVGRPVAVQIVKLHGQTPVARRFPQGGSVFIHKKAAVGEGKRLEMSLAIVEIEDIDLAVLENLPGRPDGEPAGVFGSAGRLAVYFHHDRLPVHNFDGDVRVRLLAYGGGPVVGYIKVQVAVAVHIRQCHGHGGRSRQNASLRRHLLEMAFAIVQKNSSASPHRVDQ